MEQFLVGQQTKFIDKFTIEHIGLLPVEVYDIEVEDNHNFFANDILCHNSIYITSNVPKLVKEKHGDVDNDTMIEYIISFVDKKVIPVVKNGYNELADYMNSFQKMNMKREAIADKGFFLAPKMYVIRILDDEGVRLKDPDVKHKGIEIVKSTTPSFVKPALKKFVKLLLEGGSIADVRKLCDDFKKDFFKTDIRNISKPATMNHSLKYASIPSGTPYHIKAGLLYNRYLREHKIDHIQPLSDGIKMKLVSLKVPNTFYNYDHIAYSDYFPDELRRFVDFEEQYDKMFYNVVKRIYKVLGTDLDFKRNTLPFFNKGTAHGAKKVENRSTEDHI